MDTFTPIIIRRKSTVSRNTLKPSLIAAGFTSSLINEEYISNTLHYVCSKLSKKFFVALNLATCTLLKVSNKGLYIEPF